MGFANKLLKNVVVPLFRTNDKRGNTMLHQKVHQSCVAVHQQCFGLVPH